MMKQVGVLTVVPPSQEFRVNTDLVQSGLGSFNLNLRATVRKGKRYRVIEENFQRNSYVGKSEQNYQPHKDLITSSTRLIACQNELIGSLPPPKFL